MTPLDFLCRCGCKCQEDAFSMQVGDRRVYLMPRIEVMSYSMMVAGEGPRPRVARYRRSWLRARRRAMRRTGRPPRGRSSTSVRCHGCDAWGAWGDAI